jgi:hypothetical protein
MTGRLDEISRAIGAIETSVAELQLRADEDREIRDRWHAENREAIAALTRKLDQHAAAVEMMRPSVAALEYLAPNSQYWRRSVLPASSCSAGSSRPRSNGRLSKPGRLCIERSRVLELRQRRPRQLFHH